eukprot:Nitzschia sp. Nitz4//scaffold2_size372955//8357//9500//NITZ4_000351-RA/size372955-snap-gene-0.2-mRNA-1//1//CDS//3329546560//5016//frame0
MNFEAWQMQQKAQKEEERKRKTQAAEALRSHKADAASPEAVKLSQMKEAERQKKLEAEQQLRGYRGTMSAGDTKLSAMREEERRKKQEATEMLRGYQGSLSEEQAKQAALREEERRKKQEAQQALYQSLEPTSADSESAGVTGAVAAMTGVFDVSATTEPMEPTEPVVEDSPPTESADIPAEAPPVEPFSAPEPSPVPAPVEGLDNAVAAVPPPVPAAVPTRFQFMFGVIAIAGAFSADGYLATIDELVALSIGMEDKDSMQFEYPFLAGIQQDGSYVSPDGRADVIRNLLTVGVQFIAPDQATSDATKSKILQSIQGAISNGSLKKAY